MEFGDILLAVAIMLGKSLLMLVALLIIGVVLVYPGGLMSLLRAAVQAPRRLKLRDASPAGQGRAALPPTGR